MWAQGEDTNSTRKNMKRNEYYDYDSPITNINILRYK